jgi:hypothetical protein
MRWISILPFLSFAFVAAPAKGFDLPETCRTALGSVETLTGEPGARAVVEEALLAQVSNFPKQSWTPGYCRAVADNFAAKAASRLAGAAFTTRSLVLTGVDFEAFRVASFRNSGVAPKRYFGFLDEQGLANAYETKLKVTASRVAPILNAYAAKKGLGVTVTPKEIIVTHIAEGAALLLSTDFAYVDSVHPVSGVGLDDYRHGFKQYADLVSELDATFHAHLGQIANNPERPILNSVLGAGVVRHLERILGVVSMNFEESVLGTAVMYLWEKTITEEKLRAEGRPSLNARSLDEQYVVASLVYNSGILFVEERARQIMAFDTADYLVETSEKAADKRPKLPVLRPEEADVLLERGERPPNQPTSWSAVYHILQRYGAWVGLTRFGSTFTPEGDVSAER